MNALDAINEAKRLHAEGHDEVCLSPALTQRLASLASSWPTERMSRDALHVMILKAELGLATMIATSLTPR